MRKKNKILWKQNKQFDKLVERYKEERTIKLVYQFDSILDRLKAEKKMDFPLIIK